MFPRTKIKHCFCDEILFIGDIKHFIGDSNFLILYFSTSPASWYLSSFLVLFFLSPDLFVFVSRIIWKEILYYFSSSFCSGLFKYKVLRYNTVRISNNSEVKASSSVRNNDPRYFTRHQRKFTRDTRPAPFRFSRYFWPLSPPSFFLGTNSSPTWLGSQALFPLSHSVPLSFWADIFVIICSDFQEALSLLVYRNLWYMDAQVCFLKV